MKGKKSKKNQASSTGKGEAIPLILSWGAVDLVLDITWTLEELIDLEVEWDNLNSLEDIRFLKEKKDLWQKFELSTTNPTLLTLLFLNKTSKKKSYIDYIPFGTPKFEGDDEYFSEIIKIVTEQNYLNINENALDENGRFSVIIRMHYEDKCKTIVIGTPKGSEATEEQDVHEEEEEKVSNKDNENAGEAEQKEEKQPDNNEEGNKAENNEEQGNNADNEAAKQQEGEEKKEENNEEDKKKSKEKREPPKDTTPGIPTKEEKLKKKKEEEKKKKEEEEKKKKAEEGGNAEENAQEQNAEQPGEEGNQNEEDKPKKTKTYQNSKIKTTSCPN